MSPRRFALVGPFHPYRGGIAHFQHATARTLLDRGHRVLPVTFTRQYPGRLFPGTSQLEDSQVAATLVATRCIDSIGPWSWWKSAATIRKWQPDAVVFTYWMPFFAPAFGTIARRTRSSRIRILSLVHNALPHERRIADGLLSRYFLRATDGLVVFSRAVEEDLRGLGIQRPVRRIQHPVYDVFGEAVPRAVARERLELPAAAPVALFFGVVRPYKGLHVLVEALAAAARSVPELILVVAGEFYDGEEEIRARIRHLGLTDRIRLHAAYIDNRDVGTFFGAADVVVQPYVSATQSGVAQIAFHFERPMIVTDVGGLAEVVPHERAGLVVPPEDPPALARAIIRFFAEGWGPRLAAGVLHQREESSWDRLGEALEGLVEAQRST